MNAEIICVDDCSTDDSWKILNKICLHNKICFCYKNDSNRGVSYTRNRALSLAKGKYIWFVDPDDLLCPGVVKSFLECAEREAADIVLGNYVRVEESFSLRSGSLNQEKLIVFAKTKEMILPSDNLGNKMCAVWSGMFRSGFLIDNGLRFRENMIAQEDTLFYYEMEQHFPNIIKSDDVCYLYRQRSTSVMHQKTEKRMQKYYQSMMIMLDVYYSYWNTGTYRDRSILETKILHSNENVCSCLAKCTDELFVRENFRKLKAMGYYPYPFRKETLKRKGSKIVAVFDFLLPIEICFWVVHFAYAIVNKRRFK